MKRVLRFFLLTTPLHLIMLLTALLPNTGFTTRFRGFLLSPFFKKCGKGLKVAGGVTINNPDKIVIGDNVYFAHNVWMNGVGGITFGSDISLAPMVVVVSSKHVVEKNKVTKKINTGSVKIGSGVWLASHVVVSEGVEIGDSTIIGANSVVLTNIPSNCLAAGAPAKVLKSIN